MLAVLGHSWDLCWQSWAALGVYVGGPGPLLGPMLAVLGGLGAYVGGLGLVLGPMLAVLGALGPKCGPNPEMWPKPEREQGPKGVGPSEAEGPEAPKLGRTRSL